MNEVKESARHENSAGEHMMQRQIVVVWELGRPYRMVRLCKIARPHIMDTMRKPNVYPLG